MEHLAKNVSKKGCAMPTNVDLSVYSHETSVVCELPTTDFTRNECPLTKFQNMPGITYQDLMQENSMYRSVRLGVKKMNLTSDWVKLDSLFAVARFVCDSCQHNRHRVER